MNNLPSPSPDRLTIQTFSQRNDFFQSKNLTARNARHCAKTRRKASTGARRFSWFEIAREGWVEYLIKFRRNHLLRKTDVNQVEEQNKLNQNLI